MNRRGEARSAYNQAYYLRKQAEKPPGQPRICQQCGAEHARPGKSKFCSPACGVLWRNAHRVAPRKCRVCEALVAGRGRSATCPGRCESIWQQARRYVYRHRGAPGVEVPHREYLGVVQERVKLMLAGGGGMETAREPKKVCGECLGMAWRRVVKCKGCGGLYAPEREQPEASLRKHSSIHGA